MKRFSMGTELIFGADALSFLKTLGAEKVLLVTDSFFSKNGMARSILSKTGATGEIFDRAVPDPSVALAAEGAVVMDRLKPDLLIALGGGSSLDCAKGILLAAQTKPRFAAIPTTSGTGSEVTSFSILTHQGTKHPFVDKAIRPDFAVLDEGLLAELPQGLIADAGMDAISHCMEAVCSKNASPLTEALAVSACRSLLKNLPDSYRGSIRVRGDIHLAAAMAGLAFDNAGLGLLHAIAHALGGAFHVPHGRLGGILLPAVLDFNKDAASAAYARMAEGVGLGASTQLLALRNLRQALVHLRSGLRLPATLKEAGIEKEALHGTMDHIVQAALEDACFTTNPRPASAEDVKKILLEVAE